MQLHSRHTQNFVRTNALVDRLLDASSIQPGDLVLDLGAGSGRIASRLAHRGCQVIAVENDPQLAARLRLTFDGVPNVHVRQCDILELNLPRSPYKVFSNIPFDITADILGRLTRTAYAPIDAYLVMQREAAHRFIGKPTTTLVSALLFPWFAACVFHEFRRTDFTPVPRVEVVMLRLHKRGPPLVAVEHAQLYRNVAIQLFTARSPSLAESLVRLLGKRRGARVARSLDIREALPTRVPPCRWLDLFEAVRSVAGDELRWRVAHAEGSLREQQRRLLKIHRTRARHLRPPPLRHRRPVRVRTVDSRV